METKKEWGESVNGKADQSVDTLDMPMTASHTALDMPRTDDPPEESTEGPQLESQEEMETPTRASVIPFNTPDYRFECICGELGIVDYKARVQCMNCQLWQHADFAVLL